IFTDSFNPSIYCKENLINSAISFLNKDKNELSVILKREQNCKKKNNWFLDYLKDYKEKIHLFMADDKLKEIIENCMVVKTKKGNYAVRLEMDPSEHIATGCFNAGESGRTLFNQLGKFIEEGRVKFI
ncbi:MAG: hypothetical protein AABW81_00720, partial [Nanoarchaeota archaeon]